MKLKGHAKAFVQVGFRTISQLPTTILINKTRPISALAAKATLGEALQLLLALQ